MGGQHRLRVRDTDTIKGLFERVAEVCRLPHYVMRVWPSHAVNCLQPRSNRTLFQDGFSRHTHLRVELVSSPELCHVLNGARHLVNVVLAGTAQRELVSANAPHGPGLQESARILEALLDSWQFGEF